MLETRISDVEKVSDISLPHLKHEISFFGGEARCWNMIFKCLKPASTRFYCRVNDLNSTLPASFVDYLFTYSRIGAISGWLGFRGKYGERQLSLRYSADVPHAKWYVVFFCLWSMVYSLWFIYYFFSTLPLSFALHPFREFQEKQIEPGSRLRLS